MLASTPSFSRIPIACKQKTNAIYKQCKDDNEISSNDCYEFPFYDALDSWWHQSENVMKHVNVFMNEIVGSLEFKM
jgi:hypothetical protein